VGGGGGAGEREGEGEDGRREELTLLGSQASPAPHSADYCKVFPCVEPKC